MERIDLDIGTEKNNNKIPGGINPISDIEIDKKFFKIDIEIDHARFHLTVDNILLMKRGNDGEFTDEELDTHVEQCASYRASFLSVAQLVQLKLQEKQLEYQLWNSKKSIEAKEFLINSRIIKKGQGVSATLLGGVTEKDVNDYIIVTFEEEYKIFMNEINDLKYKSGLLFGLEKIMEQRANDLRKLVDRRNKMSMRDSIS